jgi:hypothetical protein
MPPLSASAQQRLDAAICQHKQNLDVEFSQRVEEEVARRIREFVVPHFVALYEKAVKTRKGIMEYRLIWSCLHDDSRKSVSSEKLNKAFNIWTEVKLKVLNEEENPTPTFKDMPDIPGTAAEWRAASEAAAKQRRRK